MNDKTKLAVAGAAIVLGAGLMLWNLRDPNRGYYEQPKREEEVTIDQVPASVGTAIRRASAGGTVHQIQRETKQGKVKYDADIIIGGHKIGLKIDEDGSILERKTKKLKAPIQS
jgi:hypothetical protein